MNSLSSRAKSVLSASGPEPVQTRHRIAKNVSSSFNFTLSGIFLLIILVWKVEASATNITIDDSNSAFVWGTGWSPGPCDFCSAQLNQSLTYDGTWHDGGSANGSMATLNFDGTAVYLFGITSAAATGTIEFTLDGKSAMTFNGSVNIPTLNHVYNFSLFSVSGLENTSHTLDFTSILAVNASQTVLVDYAIVTVDNSTDGSSSSSSGESGGPAGSAGGTNSNRGSNKGAIIGGVVGGVVGAVLLALALFWFIRRRNPRERRIKPETDVAPFRVPPTRELSLPSTTTISSNPKAGLNRTLLGVTPDSTAPSPRSRADSGARTAITDATGGGPRADLSSPIQEMEQRLRSLESMVILQSAVLNPVRGVSEGEDSSNPPPPY